MFPSSRICTQEQNVNVDTVAISVWTLYIFAILCHLNGEIPVLQVKNKKNNWILESLFFNQINIYKSKKK
jgi:hypothetical protein